MLFDEGLVMPVRVKAFEVLVLVRGQKNPRLAHVYYLLDLLAAGYIELDGLFAQKHSSVLGEGTTSLKGCRKESWQASDYIGDTTPQVRDFIGTLQEDRISPQICYNSVCRKRLAAGLRLETSKIGIFISQHAEDYQTYDLQFRQTQSSSLREIETFYQFDSDTLQTLDTIDNEIIIKNVG